MGKKLDFSTVLTENHSYIGELALPYVLAAFTKNKTIEAPGVRVIDDIILQKYIAKLSGSGMVQVGDNCAFDDEGTIVASEVKLEPKSFYINLELCYNELESLWAGLSSGDVNSQDLEQSFSQALADVVINEMNVALEDAFWNGEAVTGATGATQVFDGIDEQITTNVVIGATGLTKDNIVAATDAMIAELPSEVLEDPESLQIWMNPKTRMYYLQALAALGMNTPADAQAKTYHGFPIYTITKIKDDKMYAFQPANLAFGLSAADNFTQFNILDLRQSTGDNALRIVLQGKADVKVIYEAEASRYDAS